MRGDIIEAQTEMSLCIFYRSFRLGVEVRGRENHSKSHSDKRNVSTIYRNLKGVSCPNISADGATGGSFRYSESLAETMNILCHISSLTAAGPEDLKTARSGQRFRQTILKMRPF